MEEDTTRPSLLDYFYAWPVLAAGLVLTVGDARPAITGGERLRPRGHGE
ncbi:MAG: hypothetical protein ACRD6W_14940 [Nitrososphaerales archaeon]